MRLRRYKNMAQLRVAGWPSNGYCAANLGVGTDMIQCHDAQLTD
jgi:hypothetical protein